MQNMKPKRNRALVGMVALAASLLVVMATLAGGTHAYLMSKTDTYVNTFVSGLPKVGELVIEGGKTLEGRSLAVGEFFFELYETDSSFEIAEDADPVQTVSNAENGFFVFSAIEFDEVGTHHYVVSEKSPSATDEGYSEYITYDNTQYRVTVTVTEGDGAFAVDSKIVAFDPALAASEVNAQKDGLAAVDDAPEGEGVSPSTPESQNIGYDGTEVETIIFTNKFDSPDPTVVMSGMKTLDGRSMAEGEFSFDLYQADADYQVAADAVPLQSAGNTAAGGFGFEALSFPEAGTYRYVIREDASRALGGVTYDDAEYRLEVTVVADPATGMLSAESSMFMQDESGSWIAVDVLQPNGEGWFDNSDGKPYVAADPQSERGAVAYVTFANAYESKPASYELVGDVDLVGRDMAEGEFLFTIEPETEGAPAPAATSDANDAQGGFGFGSLEFKEPGEYHYLVRQDASAALEGVEYDESVHRVVVTVTDDGKGQLVVSATVWRDGVQVDDGTGVKYVNKYTKPGEGGGEGPIVPPGDGDEPGDGGSDDSGTIPGGTGSGDALSQTGDAILVLVGALLVAAVCAIVVGVIAFHKMRGRH